jgi:DNA-binding NarL/FixJ family response regulator
MKLVAVFCGWAEEAIDTIKEIRPDVLLLNHSFRLDEKTGLDVARWIDAEHRAPIRVAVYGDLSQEELRQLYGDVECVGHFLSGEGVREFIADCMRGA